MDYLQPVLIVLIIAIVVFAFLGFKIVRHSETMVIERLGFEKVLDRTWKPIRTLYTLLVVMYAWVLF